MWWHQETGLRLASERSFWEFHCSNESFHTHTHTFYSCWNHWNLMQNQQWALSCISSSLWMMLCDVCKSGQEVWFYRCLGSEMRNETTVGTCDVIPCLYTSAVLFLQLHGTLMPSSGVDWGQPSHFREKKRNENQAGKKEKKKITPGRFIRDFPGWRIFLVQSLYHLCVPNCVFKDLPHVFKRSGIWWREAEGQCWVYILARLGAGQGQLWCSGCPWWVWTITQTQDAG